MQLLLSVTHLRPFKNLISQYFYKVAHILLQFNQIDQIKNALKKEQ